MSVKGNCFICESIKGTSDIPWTDRPLLLDPRFGGIIPGIGALIPGYVLMCPAVHVPNFCLASADSGFLSFARYMMEFLSDRLGAFTYFEHGGQRSDAATSACVDHAHIHAVPDRFLFELPLEDDRFASLIDFLQTGSPKWANRPYLMLGTSDGECRVAEDIGVSQYFRRQLALAVDDLYSWDYAAAPKFDLVRQTIEKVLGVGSEDNDLPGTRRPPYAR